MVAATFAAALSESVLRMVSFEKAAVLVAPYSLASSAALIEAAAFVPSSFQVLVRAFLSSATHF
jgi:hypothetical protein